MAFRRRHRWRGRKEEREKHIEWHNNGTQGVTNEKSLSSADVVRHRPLRNGLYDNDPIPRPAAEYISSFRCNQNSTVDSR